MIFRHVPSSDAIHSNIQFRRYICKFTNTNTFRYLQNNKSKTIFLSKLYKSHLITQQFTEYIPRDNSNNSTQTRT